MSLTRAQKCVLDFLENGYFPGEFNSKRQYLVGSSIFCEFLNELDRDYEKIGNRSKINTVMELGAERTTNGRVRSLIFPSLEEIRAAWDEKYPHGDWERDKLWKLSKSEF